MAMLWCRFRSSDPPPKSLSILSNLDPSKLHGACGQRCATALNTGMFQNIRPYVKLRHSLPKSRLSIRLSFPNKATPRYTQSSLSSVQSRRTRLCSVASLFAPPASLSPWRLFAPPPVSIASVTKCLATQGRFDLVGYSNVFDHSCSHSNGLSAHPAYLAA